MLEAKLIRLTSVFITFSVVMEMFFQTLHGLHFNILHLMQDIEMQTCIVYNTQQLPVVDLGPFYCDVFFYLMAKYATPKATSL